MAGESPKPRRRPSLKRSIKQAEAAGREVAAAIIRPDEIVLHFTNNLGDNRVPTIPSDDEENEWDIALRQN